MRMALVGLSAIAVFLLSASSAHAQGDGNRITTVDFVRAKPGQLARLLRFYELNWARSRRTVIQTGGISGFRLLVRADTVGTWDVALYTEYPDSGAYARREETFRPVMQAQGRTLVDGLDRSALGEIVESRILRVQVAAP